MRSKSCIHYIVRSIKFSREKEMMLAAKYESEALKF